MSDDCIFCKIIRKEIPSNIAYEDDDVLAFHDINPAAPVHILIIPKVHVAKVGEFTEETSAVIPKLMAVSKHLAEKHGMLDEGYRLVFNSGDNGGQTVYHVHMHLLGGRVMRWPPG
jgi:histidine triad (HIT) family protein